MKMRTSNSFQLRLETVDVKHLSGILLIISDATSTEKTYNTFHTVNHQ